MGVSASVDRRVACWLWACFALVFAAFTHGRFAGSDEWGLFATTRALFEAGDLALPFQKHVFEGRDGRGYSIFAAGQAVLALPFYAVGTGVAALASDRWALVLAGPATNLGRPSVELFFVGLYAPVASGLLVALFYLLQRRFGASVRGAATAAALLGAGTYVAGLSVFFLRHVTETCLMLGALLAFHRYRSGGGPGWLALGCLAASWLPLVRLPAAAAGPGLAFYLAWVLHGRRTREPDSSLAPVLLAVALPVLLCATAHFAITWYKWGSLFSTPVTGQALSTPLLEGLHGLLLSPGCSVFLYSPLLLLLPWIWPAFWRSHRGEACAVALISVCFLGLVAKYEGWTGLWSAPGPRYVYALTPLLLLPLGPWLDRLSGAGARAALVVLAAGGVAVQLGIMLARWGAVVVGMDYLPWAPKMGFVFVPELSPILGTWRFVSEGAIDVWLWNAFHGLGPIAPWPGAAVAVFLCWALLVAASLRALVRSLSLEDRDTGTVDPARG